MMHTGAVIVGNIATSFFTGEVPAKAYCNSLDVVLSNTDTISYECWFSLLKGDFIASGSGRSGIVLDIKVCSLFEASSAIAKGSILP